jgi:Arginine methyltransferase-interacting protein, contains RING Zn-finger
LDRLISRLIKAEDSLKSSKGGKDNVAFKAQGLIKKSEFVCHNCNYKEHFSRDCNKPKKKLFCNFCKKVNHTEDRCYVKNNEKTMPTQCVHCQRTNHKSENCFFKPCTYCRRTNHKSECCFHKNRVRERLRRSMHCWWKNVNKIKSTIWKKKVIKFGLWTVVSQDT